jgi:hypothetical protein
MPAVDVTQRESFLAEVRVAVVSVADDRGRGPWAVPMWFEYEPGGDVCLLTDRGGRMARLIRGAGRLGICVHSDDPPYQYVSVEGPVGSVEESVTVERRRALARRYLGPEGGDDYVERTAGATGRIIAIHMRPERWLAVDQGREGTP